VGAGRGAGSSREAWYFVLVVGVFHDQDFEAQLAALKADSERLDDAIRGVEQLLSEQPDAGVESEVPGIFVFRLRLPSSEGLVRVSIFFTYDGQDVTFRSLRRSL
jgi:hypothetical protein